MLSRGSVKECSFTQPSTPKTPTILPSRTCRSSTDAPSGRGRLGRLLDQLAHFLGRLRALLDPLGGLGRVELQLDVLAGGDRVVEPEALDAAAVARIALVGDHDVVERAAVGAAGGQTNLHHDAVLGAGVRLLPALCKG